MSKIGEHLQFLHHSGQKGIAWLIDPEKGVDPSLLPQLSGLDLDLIFIGGSASEIPQIRKLIQELKFWAGNIPICIFPGSHLQVYPEADAILFLSLISGRNPEYLIGQQVKAAEEVSQSNLEVLPTGYLLVNEGEILSVHSVSQTLPLLNSQKALIGKTALAGKLMGMKYFFLDAGSGATLPVRPDVISEVKLKTKSPLLVGGGLDSKNKVNLAFEGGADLVVVGNGIEKDPGFLAEVLNLKKWYNHSLNIN